MRFCPVIIGYPIVLGKLNDYLVRVELEIQSYRRAVPFIMNSVANFTINISALFQHKKKKKSIERTSSF